MLVVWLGIGVLGTGGPQKCVSLQTLEEERASHDEELRTQDETQRQIDECLAFKLSKQSEEELGRSIDAVNAQIGDVSTGTD